MDQLFEQCEDEVRDCLQMFKDGKDFDTINKKVIKEVMFETINALFQYLSTFSKPKEIESVTKPPSVGEDSIVKETTQSNVPTDVVKTSPSTGMINSEPKVNTEPSICPNHVKKPCKKRDCTLPHPEWCQKAWQHGLIKYDKMGCDKESCEKFHPFFCRRSLLEKKCFNKKCTAVHVKGTQRKKTQPPPSDNQNSSSGKKSKGGTPSKPEGSSAKPEAPQFNPYVPPPQQMPWYYSSPNTMRPQPLYSQVASGGCPPQNPPYFFNPSSGQVARSDFLRLENRVEQLFQIFQQRLQLF